MKQEGPIEVQFEKQSFGYENVLYGVHVNLYDGEYTNSSIVKTLNWNGYSLSGIVRWNWYFRYRACLLQIANPKKLVVIIKYKKDILDEQTLKINAAKKLKNQIAAKKGTITKTQNAVKRYEDDQSKSLIPDYDFLPYKMLKEKLSRLEDELEELHKKLKTT